MSHRIDRRDFLKTTGGACVGIGVLGMCPSPLLAASAAKGAPNAEKLGWRLGCQAYSFNRFTFHEAIEKTASLGLHWIEAYPGQRLSKAKPDVRTGESMPADIRKDVKTRLADAGVKLVNFGVVGSCNRKLFDFAKEMGIETITCEPDPAAFDDIEKLCDEYDINAAIHNHPKPSRYWNPDTVLKVCKGRGKRIGACADTGHWMRSGIKPIEALKKLEGRTISFHFKDLDKFGRGAHDVPWGTGQGDVRGMLAELHRQGFQGVFSVEYEHNWTNSLPEIAQSVQYFDKVAAELGGQS